MGKKRENKDSDLEKWVTAETKGYVDPNAQPPKGISRRRALSVIGAGGAVGVGLLAGQDLWLDPITNRRRRRRRPGRVTTTTTQPPATSPSTSPPTTEPPPPPVLWSSPGAWDGGQIPGPDDIAVVKRPITLDIDTQVAGVQIEPSGQLIYDPAASHTLASEGNVVVHGLLQMRPANAATHHVLSFVGVNEGGFTGGHTDNPIDGDVGVWVMHAGVLDLQGASKAAWTNLAAEAGRGAPTIAVDDAAGWQVGDEIVVTPTEPAHGDEDHWEHHDRRMVTAVSGNQVSLNRPLDYAHPFVTVRQGVTHRPEVVNISRNVRIEGAADARAHVILLHAMRPQAMAWTGLRQLGPAGVLGRYALHFHMCGDGVRGSTLDGLAASDCGNHAFVVHLSNGVTLTDCVTHDTVDDAYWWDQGDQDTPDANPSDDVTYDRCLASYVHMGENPHTTAGFLMAAGAGNVARNCVATGIDGRSFGACGFRWTAHARDENKWIFEDNLTHNNRWSGIYYWQNHARRTIVDRFTCYHVAQGIFAGSYSNLVSYRDNILYGFTKKGLTIHATPGSPRETPDETITYEGMYVDAAGLTDYAVEIPKHVLDQGRTTLVSGCTFKGATQAQVAFTENGDINQLYDFVDCSFEGTPFWLHDGVPDNSQIRVMGGTHGGMMVHPAGGPGRAQAAWNATTTAI
jgi:hypothetical protein